MKQILINLILTCVIVGILTGVGFLITPEVLDVEYDWNMWVWMEFAHRPDPAGQDYALITGEIFFQEPRGAPKDKEELLQFILRKGSYQSLTRRYHPRAYLVVAIVVFVFVTISTALLKRSFSKRNTFRK